MLKEIVIFVFVSAVVGGVTHRFGIREIFRLRLVLSSICFLILFRYSKRQAKTKDEWLRSLLENYVLWLYAVLIRNTEARLLLVSKLAKLRTPGKL
jgi:hypothetical protein